MKRLRHLVRGVPVALVAVGVVTATGQAQGAVPSAVPVPTEADVQFMQGMMVHHAQAVEMTALVADRTERADLRLLAGRIEVSQRDEMELMRRWLEDRGHAVADGYGAAAARAGHDHGHHGPTHGDHGSTPGLMPGMLDAEEMARLRGSTGEEFERLFLEAMIYHHEGALIMVAELFATDGAAQDPEMFQFASHVESDQRIEIARMRRMLAAAR